MNSPAGTAGLSLSLLIAVCTQIALGAERLPSGHGLAPTDVGGYVKMVLAADQAPPAVPPTPPGLAETPAASPAKPAAPKRTITIGAAPKAAIPQPAPVPLLELHDGDRVILLGDTFIERENDFGYLEA